MFVMAMASMPIAAVPAYAKEGDIAHILYSLLRFAQGFAIGGITPNSLLLTIESSYAKRFSSPFPLTDHPNT